MFQKSMEYSEATDARCGPRPAAAAGRRRAVLLARAGLYALGLALGGGVADGVLPGGPAAFASDRNGSDTFNFHGPLVPPEGGPGTQTAEDDGTAGGRAEGDDDGPAHDANDEDGNHDDGNDDGPGHDVDDDAGQDGEDDGPDHDAHDDAADHGGLGSGEGGEHGSDGGEGGEGHGTGSGGHAGAEGGGDD